MKNILAPLFVFTTMLIQAQSTNYHFSHTESTSAAPDKIWAVWTDVANWKQWDTGLKEAVIMGEFKNGVKGKLKPDKGPRSKFIITDVVENQSYTFKTKIPFGWLVIKRSMQLKESKTFFSHDVEFTGIMKKMLGNQLGKKYKTMLPVAMKNITKIAEAQ